MAEERVRDSGIPLASISPVIYRKGFNEYPDESPIDTLSHVCWRTFERQEVRTTITRAIAGRSSSLGRPAHVHDVRDQLIDLPQMSISGFLNK